MRAENRCRKTAPTIFDSPQTCVQIGAKPAAKPVQEQEKGAFSTCSNNAETSIFLKDVSRRILSKKSVARERERERGREGGREISPTRCVSPGTSEQRADSVPNRAPLLHSRDRACRISPMPIAPLRACASSKCPNKAPRGSSRCPECQQPIAAAVNTQRGSASSRGYDARHRNWRKAILSRDPVCKLRVKCEGDPSNVADHITPMSRGGKRFAMDNGQGLCKPCHDWKTATKDGGLRRRVPAGVSA